MLSDSPDARSTATAMRDFLRQLDRQTITPPARPNNPPPPALALSATQSAETGGVRVGAWVLTEDEASGDLVAAHANGTRRVIATRGES